MDHVEAPPSHVSIESRLEHIPDHLKIQVLHVDNSIIVIEKPCNLRSVPGHAIPPPPANTTTRTKKRYKGAKQVNDSYEQQVDTDDKRTAQEAWVAAIESLRQEEDIANAAGSTSIRELVNPEPTKDLLSRLANTNNANSIPRKWKLFRKYVQRNRSRLIPNYAPNDLDEESLVRQVHQLLRTRQERLMSLPQPTAHEESALGQLILMGYACNIGNFAHDEATGANGGIYVVHRLDCETSGVMVFARTEDSASLLCQAWRERRNVEKQYLARVQCWPPFHDKHQCQGIIDLPLAPSEERLKWEVRLDGSGKESMTKWKVRKAIDKESLDSHVLLELIPVTGRTHQLRVHCAAVGSGICGDSLYDKNPIEWNATQASSSAAVTLSLHAHILKFPHPETGETVNFVSSSPWSSE